MKKEIVFTPKAPAAIGPYSQAVKAGNLLFVSGQVAFDPATGDLVMDTIEIETERVMANLAAILEEANSSFAQVVKCTIFLSDMNNFGLVNAIYGKYFGENPPARETVEVARLPKDVNVEISCIALI